MELLWNIFLALAITLTVFVVAVFLLVWVANRLVGRFTGEK